MKSVNRKDAIHRVSAPPTHRRPRTADVAVIGAGPAGATVARILAEGGARVLLFDYRAPWEKPCGGMLSPGAMEILLEDGPYPGSWAATTDIEYILPRGDRSVHAFRKPVALVSRREMGEYLLGKATSGGAGHVAEKVTGIARAKAGWEIRTARSTFHAHTLAGADGMHGIVRGTVSAPIRRADMALCCGYFLDPLENARPVIRFSDMQGYAWIFPRGNDTSAGIGARHGEKKGADLFRELDGLIADTCPGARVRSRWSAVLPMAAEPGFFDSPCAGDGWLLLGDAAGLAHPVTGEGILYALLSGRLAAQCILEGAPLHYDQAWRAGYGAFLAESTRIARADAALGRDFGPGMRGALMYKRFMEIMH
ncbi:MAG: geranylgeranyl reductase family protein [Spirochaetes bacterium]|nr:MAG: geranylgeranyl reductase family protein [Spirochaetota bacterium]